jgi:F-type H+-transporting ATPase subunit b
MKRLIGISLLMALPVLLLAGGAGGEESRYLMQTGRETDFVPRLFNFVIFAGLLYYLLAGPIKSYFKERSEAIEKRLNEIEVKLQASKDAQKEAQARLDRSQSKAKEIVEDAKVEAKLLASKIAQANENELEILQKQQEEKITLEERKSAREAIDEVLSENITINDINLDETKVVEILSKKSQDGKVA